MFISNRAKIDDETKTRTKDSDIVEKAGIIDRRRAIHIFYDMNNPSSCKVIQINVSVTCGKDVLFDKTFMNRHNGSLSFIGVYVFDCELNTVGKSVKEMFTHGKLHLISARRMDRETDYDNDVTRSETAQLYSKLFQNYHVSEYVDARVLVNPKYYTQEHEYQATGDYNPDGMLDDIYIPYILGVDLIDDVTELYQQDPGLFRTIRDSIMIQNNSSLFNESTVGDEGEASYAISNLNFNLGCDSLVNGGVFVYDSQHGMNFKNSSIVCKKYITKEDAINEFETFMLSLQSVGKLLEGSIGSIRLMYSPSLLGSKCRVILKDFNNKVDDYGMKSVESKDSSHEVTQYVAEMIQDDSGLFAHRGLCEGVQYDPFQKGKTISYDY